MNLAYASFHCLLRKLSAVPEENYQQLFTLTLKKWTNMMMNISENGVYHKSRAYYCYYILKGRAVDSEKKISLKCLCLCQSLNFMNHTVIVNLHSCDKLLLFPNGNTHEVDLLPRMMHCTTSHSAKAIHGRKNKKTAHIVKYYRQSHAYITLASQTCISKCYHIYSY